MSTIEKLLKEKQDLEKSHSEHYSKIETKLQAAFDAIFSDWPALHEAIKQLESSKAFGCDEGGVFRWIRFNELSDVAIEHRWYLNHYLQWNSCIHADYDNDCLIQNEGPAIIINEDGDIFDQDSDKLIVDHNEYQTEAERNALIESWMEAKGYFPGVFYCDRYCNVTLIDTQSK